jgi:prephenate dehydrogenase
LQLGVFGTGLIGASFALAAKRAGAAAQVLGYDHSQAALDEALALGIVDRACDSPAALAAGADLILVAVPVGAFRDVLTTIASHLKPNAWVMDVGSTKASAIADARAALGEAFSRFVPAHPIAGAEKSGPAAANADLFRNRYAILTPTPETQSALVARATTLWERIGARLVRMDAAAHDTIFSAVSHLPHLASFALVAEYAGRSNGPELFRFAGGGFRDFARIAGSSPAMWRDIALANREAVLADMDSYIAALQRMRQDIAEGDANALHETMASARQMRERWLAGDFDVSPSPSPSQ